MLASNCEDTGNEALASRRLCVAAVEWKKFRNLLCIALDQSRDGGWWSYVASVLRLKLASDFLKSVWAPQES